MKNYIKNTQRVYSFPLLISSIFEYIMIFFFYYDIFTNFIHKIKVKYFVNYPIYKLKMLRESQLRKYKNISEYDLERFVKEDEEYLLKENRPIKEKFIQLLNDKKADQFMDDILTNKELTSVLYNSNAKIEINKYLRNKKNLCPKQLYPKNLKRTGPKCFEDRRKKREAYSQIKEEINNFYLNKDKYFNKLSDYNKQMIKKIKKELALEREEFNNEMKNNKIKGFQRAYSCIKNKLNNSKNRVITKENSNSFITNTSYTSNNKSILLPSVRLNLKNVYNRLYNNAIFSPIKLPSKKNSRKIRDSIIQTSIPKLKLNLKKVLKSTNGKEFTVKITKNILNRCFEKYSGGPKMINESKIDTIDKGSKMNYYVDYYKLINKKNGNSLLHSASYENQPELVKYFIEKNSNVNLQNFEGDTPLHLALKNKNKKIIKILMNNKAALNIPNNKGNSPYELYTSEMKKEFGIENLICTPIKKVEKIDK